MRVVFMGTPEFSVPVLEALIAAGHEVVAVYCQPPRPAGRGKKLRPSPVHARAGALGLPVRCPVNFRNASDIAAFQALGADIAVVVAYGLILPPAILAAPRHGCVNIHASLLPRWRGAAPIHRALMAGDEKTGVCVMEMEAGLDTGPVLLRRETAILASDTTASLHDRLSKMGATAIVEALARLDDLTPQPQGDHGVTYAAKITKAEARIDWQAPAPEVDRKIRGLSPFPGAWCLIGDERIKILNSCVADGAGPAGTVLEDEPASRLTVACGAGAVRLLRVQRAGKGAMDAATYLRGHPLPVGAQLD